MNILIFIYTVLLFIGSLIGYFKAGSVASLMMGTLSTGSLLSFLFLTRKKPLLAYRGLFITLLILSAFFTLRWIKMAHFLPAGALSLFSWSVLIFLSYYMRQKKE
ncbi:TMEM14 family protein [Rhabdochlamydiaceae symbiont of Dictyostelium giganteum]|uniref:TMEM14 family protein n=1 Tax=Rhabdochlamydiaceae symbiont of Dictyostelium giganteum TaxID=3342349 RepID=UPI00384FB3C4